MSGSPDPIPPEWTPAEGEDPALARLDGICRSIALGDYGQADALFALMMAADASPTVRRLADSFGFMLVQVEARELRLTDLVGDLKRVHGELEEANRRLERENAELSGTLQRLTVDIDRAKLREDVGAIVETEYFQALQQRARDMRARARGQEPGDEPGEEPDGDT